MASCIADETPTMADFSVSYAKTAVATGIAIVARNANMGAITTTIADAAPLMIGKASVNDSTRSTPMAGASVLLIASAAIFAFGSSNPIASAMSAFTMTRRAGDAT